MSVFTAMQAQFGNIVNVTFPVLFLTKTGVIREQAQVSIMIWGYFHSPFSQTFYMNFGEKNVAFAGNKMCAFSSTVI